jgi:hypothetical protein
LYRSRKGSHRQRSSSSSWLCCPRQPIKVILNAALGPNGARRTSRGKCETKK